jgi:pyruvate formate lyase activating enzyme
MAAGETDEDSACRATVLNIQRMSTEDGPGLRTTVFLKGCSLACSWCHNPEAVTFEPQVVWHATRCIQSQVCDAVCDEAALARHEGAVEIDFARCTGCGGEPGLHHSFVRRFLQHCRARGFHTAVDTSGMCSPAALHSLSESADLVLYDLKEIDSRKHREFTGQPNA